MESKTCSTTIKEREEKKRGEKADGIEKSVCLALGKLTTDDGGERSSSSIIYSVVMLFVGNERARAHTHIHKEEKLSAVV